MSTKSNARVDVVKQASTDACLVRVSGTVDETFDARDFDDLPSVVVFDMDQVHSVTSYGVREWISALKRLPSEYYCFIHCRPAMVVNFNLVHSFGVAGQLVSLYAPFCCDSCDENFEILVDLRNDYGIVAESMPRATCPRCSRPADLDDVPEAYFQYCAARPPPRPPASAASVIDGEVAPRAEPFRISKEVVASVTALWMSGTLDDRVRFTRIADGLEGIVVMVLANLEPGSARGLARFMSFARSRNISLYAARVPAPLLEALLRNDYLSRDGAGLPFSIVSVAVSTQCSACGQPGAHDLELTSSGWSKPGPECSRCTSPMGGLIEPDLRAVLAKMPDVPVPAPVADYLELRPGTQHPAEEVDNAVLAGPQAGTAFGRYRLLRRLGHGGMAEVFLAQQLGPDDFQREVALKRLLPHYSDNERLVRMFTQEAKIVTRLSHPNVVQVFDFGKIASQYYLAMEYVRGIDLGQCLRRLAKLDEHMPVEIALFVVKKICAGLGAAHELRDETGKSTPILHRDVSPQNVLLSTKGAVKVVDFGIAKTDDSPSQTEHGTIKGKAAYIAPERIRTPSAVDVRSDVFSAGVILHECLTRTRLFFRENDLASLRAILSDPIPSVSASRPECGPELDAIVERALARDPTDRYQAAHELEAALERHLARLGRTVTKIEFAQWLEPRLSVTDAHEPGAEPDAADDEGKTELYQDLTITEITKQNMVTRKKRG